MGLLKIIGPYFGAWDMSRNCENRHRASMAIVESVNEMKIAGTATARADREFAGDVRIGARGEGRHFLMADVDPLDCLLSAYLVRYPIQRIADNSIHSLHSGLGQSLNQAFCNGSHDSSRLVRSKGTDAYGKGFLVSVFPIRFRI
jgi:hypothetical protein